MRSSSRLRRRTEEFLDQGALAERDNSGKIVEGAVVGCDFAGTVEKLGTGVEDNVRKVGDCGAGFLQGGTLIQLLSPILSLIPRCGKGVLLLRRQGRSRRRKGTT